MRIALCDDNLTEAAEIHAMISEYVRLHGFVCDIAVFHTGEALLGQAQKERFDLYILDIYLEAGQLDGMEVARRIRQDDAQATFVFITSSRDHALDGFAVGATGYITKPVQREDLANALQRCQELFLRTARSLEVVSERQTIRIPFVRILYVEIFGKDALIHTDTGIFKTYMPLDDIEAKLDASLFLRCHRSFLVNMSAIVHIGEQDLSLTNGDNIPMRQRHRRDIRAALSRFHSERLLRR